VTRRQVETAVQLVQLVHDGAHPHDAARAYLAAADPEDVDAVLSLLVDAGLVASHVLTESQAAGQ